MKTPIQEAIDLIDKRMEPILKARKDPSLLSKVDRLVLFTYQQVQRDLYGLLEKEKEAMCGSFGAGELNTEEKDIEFKYAGAEEWYNETFNTKE